MYSFIRHLRPILLASVLSISPLRVTQAIAQTPATSDESSLREFVSRFAGENAQILIGQLPEQLPVNLPLLEESRVVGSVVFSYGAQNQIYQIFLNVPRSPAQLQTDYREQLQAAGWQEQQELITSIGFVSAASSTPGFAFCNESEELALSVSLRPNSQSSTAVDVGLFPAERSACSLESRQFSTPESSIPLPALTPPADALVAVGNSASSEDYWISRASIESPLANQALVAHYVAQLERSGWTVQASETVGRTAWSYLTLENEQGEAWQGLLAITASDETANEYTASLSVSQQ